MNKKRGAFTTEYAVFITIIIAAMIAMHSYIERAITGAWKQSADSIGFGLQYDPSVTYIYRYVYS